MKNKKPLIITLIVIDIAITVFLFVISIIMLASTAKYNSTHQVAGGLIGYLQQHPTVYGLGFVVPLFILLAGNIIGLVIFVKRSTKRQPIQVEDLTDEQKEAIRQELLKELQSGTGENNDDNKE